MFEGVPENATSLGQVEAAISAPSKTKEEVQAYARVTIKDRHGFQTRFGLDLTEWAVHCRLQPTTRSFEMHLVEPVTKTTQGFLGEVVESVAIPGYTKFDAPLDRNYARFRIPGTGHLFAKMGVGDHNIYLDVYLSGRDYYFRLPFLYLESIVGLKGRSLLKGN